MQNWVILCLVLVSFNIGYFIGFGRSATSSTILIDPQPITPTKSDPITESDTTINKYSDLNQESQLLMDKSRVVLPLLKHMGITIGNVKEPMIWNSKYSPENKVIVDVGVYDGSDWSWPAAVKKNHIVYAFEPSRKSVKKFKEYMENSEMKDELKKMVTFVEVVPGNIPKFERTHILKPGKGHIYLIQAAAANYTGSIEFFQGKHAAQSSLTQDNIPSSSREKNSYEVAVVRIDDVVKEDVYLLKADTQGHEMGVLRGADYLLSNFRVDMIESEFAPRLMRQGGNNPVKFLDYIHSKGFLCFDWGSWGHIAKDRPDDFEGFVDAFSNDKGMLYGRFDEIICSRNHK